MEKLTLREKFFFGVGSLGKDLYMGFISYYLMIYLTDVFGMSALAVGTLFFVARLWDAINDPMMGVIADKTETRWGKYRPYMLFIPFIAAITFVLMLFPVDLPPMGKIVWAYITYIGIGMAYTALDIPMMAMVPTFTTSDQEKTSILAFQRWFAFLAFVLAASFTIPMVKYLGNGDDAKGYMYYGFIVAIVSLISSLLCFFNVKEKRDLGKLPVNKTKDYIEILKVNKPFQKVVGIRIAYDFGMQMTSGVTTYWIIYFLKKPELIPYLMPMSMGSGLIGFMFIPKIIEKIGKKSVSNWGFIGLIVSCFMKYFCGSNIIMLVLALILAGFAISALNLANISMLADTAEYTHWKLGKRSDSLLFALNTFAYKIALAVSGGVIGLVLAISNYVPNVEQTPYTLKMLNLMFGIGPVIFLIFGMILVKKYEITEDKYAEMIKDIEAGKIGINN